ncbi:MAG: hypothetical protein C4519_19990 [Desulfobacteraceae bacterium]|nr:MAG: hypothetical protein C4519_19990 [Desulfobacteraceae bacterium]
MTWAAFLLITWAMLDIYNPGFHWMWDIRPDFICYGQTLLGLYLIHLRIERSDKGPNPKNLLWAAVGGSLVGFGNAIILKGIPFIAAFVLTQVTIALKDDRAKFYSLMNFRNLRKSFIIGASAVFSFCAWVAVDCYLSKVQVGKWVSAVILLNSRKHFIFSNAGTNPIAAILEPFSVSLPLALVLVGWIIWELLNSENSARLKNSCLPVWLFSIFTILINIILPAYSNGVTWSYYFIPSVFAAAAICLVLVLRLWQIYRLRPFARPFSISQVAVVLIAGFIAVKIVNTPMYAISQWSARQTAAKEVEAASPDDFGIEERLPKDFVYLGYPDQTPIKSRNWNYYFMLARSTDFWRDCYILGLGPDPQQAWGKGFGDNPPDAIAFTQRGELSRFVFFVRECQHIDISWLFDEVRENYVLMGTRGASLYVRKDRVSHLKSQGWRILASSKTGLLPFDPT